MTKEEYLDIISKPYLLSKDVLRLIEEGYLVIGYDKPVIRYEPNMEQYYKDCDYLTGENSKGIKYDNCIECYRYDICKHNMEQTRNCAK